MLRLLAMMFTAYDSRKNPAAGLLRRTTSHVLDSVAKLTEPSLDTDASAATAEDYAKKLENMHGQHEFGRTLRVLGAPDRVISVRAARYA